MALRSDWSLKQADKVFLDRHSRSSLLPALRLPEAVTACRCVWLGVVAVALGLQHMYEGVCLCMRAFKCPVCSPELV